jgi:Icc-related predicted phosphoesterase
MAGGKTRTTEVTVLTAADLHQSKKLYAELASAVKLHQPDIVALVGDFLHAGDDMKGRLSAVECAVLLSTLPCHEVIFTRGNHEDDNWPRFAEQWRQSNRPLHALNGEVFTFGPLLITGFPCLMGTEDHYLGLREPLPYLAEEWLKPMLRIYGAAMRTLWLAHEPPRGTRLSQADGPVSGNQEWNDAIEYFRPKLLVCGHDHFTPIKTRRWHCKLGRTICVNVGQTDYGPIRHTVIKARFVDAKPDLPAEIEVTAYPAGRTILVP